MAVRDSETETEDIEFSWRLRLKGEKVYFDPRAAVYGEMVSRGGKVAEGQRQRWEVGRKQLRNTFAGKISEVKHFNSKERTLLLINLWMPPLARLAVGLGAAWGLLGISSLLSWPAPWVLCFLIFAYTGVLLLYLISPLVLLKLSPKYVLTLLAFGPYFVFWKLKLLFKKGPTSWVRTGREKE